MVIYHAFTNGKCMVLHVKFYHAFTMQLIVTQTGVTSNSLVVNRIIQALDFRAILWILVSRITALKFRLGNTVHTVQYEVNRHKPQQYFLILRKTIKYNEN